MKAAGMIVEYNPLHYGHIHHIEETKRRSGADILIAVMSGNVVQRGEFSVIDKFEKTRWALKAGIDLVVELPGVFVLQNADYFARTSVATLDALQCDDLVFGSECGSTQTLKTAAEITRTDAYQSFLQKNMQEGKSYPTSANDALKTFLGEQTPASPNDILGVQYIEAIYQQESPMKPLAIPRIESGYYSPIDEKQAIQSATAIRKHLFKGKDISPYTPPYVQESFKEKAPLSLHAYTPYMRYLLASHSPRTLVRVFSFEEGLENHVLKHHRFKDMNDLIKKLSSRRYTYAKIKRSLMHALIHIEKNDIFTFSPPYIRLLGMNEQGRNYLNTIKKEVPVPIISKLKRDKHPYLDIELKITKLHDLGTKEHTLRKEFDHVMIK